MKFNINDYVKVKLTDYGREIHKEKYVNLFQSVSYTYKYTPSIEDSEGYSIWQLWDLMNIFGPYLSMGMTKLPFETELEIITKEENL